MAKKSSLIFILLMLSCLIYPQSKNTYKLSGGVVDSTLGTGLVGANVTVISRVDGKTLAQTSCDEKGYFTASDIPESNVRAKFPMLGYQIYSCFIKHLYFCKMVKVKSNS